MCHAIKRISGGCDFFFKMTGCSGAGLNLLKGYVLACSGTFNFVYLFIFRSVGGERLHAVST